ncbi:DUF126 domain-containing protein [Rhodobacteraceae bacterium NNCM2]|nr:DUF126 domain-containing protein [Coraliihabitans acroporae]
MSVAREPALILTGGRGVGAEIRGPALVSQHGFGVRYDLDPSTGVISNRDHDLFGESVTGRVLVFTEPKGGVAASWSLAGLKERGIAPLGLIFRRASPIFVQGTVFAGLSLIDCLDRDPCANLMTGDTLRLIPSEGRVEAFR